MTTQERENAMGDDSHLKNDDAGKDEMQRAFDAIEALKEKDPSRSNVVSDEEEQPQNDDEPEVLEESEEAEEEEVPKEPPSDDEEQIIEPPKEKKKNKKPWNPLKEQFVLHDALEKKEQENALLRSLLQESKTVSDGTYSALIEKEVTDAKRALSNALTSGDADAAVEAQLELNKAAYKQQDFYRSKAEQEYQQKMADTTPAPADPLQPNKAQEAILNDWGDYIKETYPTLVKNSRHYDAALYEDVANMVDGYNRDLIKRGYGDAINSVEYFQKINDGIESINNQRRQERKPKASLPPVPIAGVRNAYANSTHGVTTSRPKDKPKLTAEVLSIIDNFSAPWMNSNELKKHWEKNL